MDCMMEMIELSEVTHGLERMISDRSAARSSYENLPAENRHLWSALAELGLTGLSLPDALGGVGLGIDAECAVLERLAYFVAPAPMIPAYLANRVFAAVEDFASMSDRAERAASDLMTGTHVVGVCLSAGTGLEHEIKITTHESQVTLDGTIGDVVDGTTIEFFIVPAEERWWLVAASDCNVAPIPALDETHSRASVTFEASMAIEIASTADRDELTSLAYVLVAAEALGAAQAALDIAVDHANTREQFGEKIGRFQAIKQKLADSLIAVEGARSAVWGALHSQHGGFPQPQEAITAKLLAGQAAVSVANDAVQTLGAMGVTWEHDLHLLLRRAKHCQQLLATPGRLVGGVAERLLSDAAAPTVGTSEKIEDRLALSAADRGFLDEFRGWLDDHATPARLEAVRRGGLTSRREWQAEMAEGNWSGIHWPTEFGGRDASFTQQVLFYSEITARGIPPLVGNRGVSLVAPTLIRHGTATQQALLEATRRADILWSTGFSERGAGSDLASLRTRGDIDGDELVINGHKIWTSGAHFADWMYLLIRTDFDAPKHEGISCVVFPMNIEGITVRPIKLNNEKHSFNEVFFDDVRIPLDGVVGGLHKGWTVNRTTMAHEHFTNFLGAHARHSMVIQRIIRRLAEYERRTGELDHDLRHRVVMSWMNVQLLQLHGFRNVMKIREGVDPGPEGSIQKLFGQEEEKRLFELAIDVDGADGLIAGRWTNNYLSSKAATIGGGTSEIHRNKLAEQVLGLPRDLWADDKPKLAVMGG
jgi:alkylation response protein AidB-like acyl-CoA dehydrogenase